ncbi:family 43 glycosylhydrolase [Luteipulveratus mongoliensis]|uniref:Glycosyl hydrolase family 32 n=1 Tax=Luteipulveratus mongoliensis TaxID=571913 RepID=A0A0K1JPY5_9MICO|nr:family 43 glycosylhydrolase [Luteipulveratus mongoliensis]AKU18663.1 glycosyl hydrolase family 32 [Luteipulveratus mongoliensis]
MVDLSRRALLQGGAGLVAAAATPWTQASGHRTTGVSADDLRWAGCGEWQHVFDPSLPGTPRYLNDHTVFRAADGQWHLISIVGNLAPAGQFPDGGKEITLAHATAPAVRGPWTAQPDALTLDPDYYGEQHLWAPFVVADAGTYYMFYAAGGSNGCAINLATSSDLVTWTRSPDGPLFRGVVARDPMVLRVGDQWVMYYTEVQLSDHRHTVAYRTSSDLRHWSAPGTVLVDPITDASPSVTESPYVVAENGWYYLFLGPRNGYVGTDVFRSRDPLSFSIDNWAGHLPGHAVEIVQDDGVWLATAAGSFEHGLLVADLQWHEQSIGWQSPENPVAGVGVDGRLHVFALSKQNRSLLHRVQTDPAHDTWSEWETFGGPAGAVPTLATNTDGRLEVFSLAAGAVAIDHRVQRADGTWEDWEAGFGGPAGAAPAVARNADGRLELYAMGPGGAYVAQRVQSSPGSRTWQPWVGNFTGPVGAPPVVGTNADGRLEVFVLRPGGARIDHRWQNQPNGSTDWSVWEQFGTAAGAAPRVARDGSGRLTVTALAPVGTGAFSRTQSSPSGGWADWRWMASWSLASPAVAALGDGRLSAASTDPAGERVVMSTQSAPGADWSSEVDLGSMSEQWAATPTIVTDSKGRSHLLGVTIAGALQRRVLVGSGGWSAWTSFGTGIAPVPTSSPT